MRDIKLRIKIIWALIKDDYTASRKYNTWRLWTEEDIVIGFGRENCLRKAQDKSEGE